MLHYVFAMMTACVAVGQPNTAGATRIAVVNLALVSARYQKTSDLEGKFELRRQELQKQRNALRDKIERVTRSLKEELKPGTPEYDQRRKELALLEAEHEWFVDTEGQKVEEGLAQSLRAIYDDIHAVVQEVAEDWGIDIVLAADQLPEEAPSSSVQARQHIMLQKVVYWSPEVDITSEVITRLNAKYKSASADGPSGGARPPFDQDAVPSGGRTRGRHPD